MGRKRSVNQRAIIIRDNCCCRRCGIGIEITALEIHHIHPVHLGGSDKPINLITLCPLCHAAAPDDPTLVPAFLESVPDYMIANAVRIGAPNPMRAAREMIQSLKRMKAGLAEDADDLEAFLPYFDKGADSLRDREWSETARR